MQCLSELYTENAVIETDEHSSLLRDFFFIIRDGGQRSDFDYSSVTPDINCQN